MVIPESSLSRENSTNISNIALLQKSFKNKGSSKGPESSIIEKGDKDIHGNYNNLVSVV